MSKFWLGVSQVKSLQEIVAEIEFREVCVILQAVYVLNLVKTENESLEID